MPRLGRESFRPVSVDALGLDDNAVAEGLAVGERVLLLRVVTTVRVVTGDVIATRFD